MYICCLFTSIRVFSHTCLYFDRWVLDTHTPCHKETPPADVRRLSYADWKILKHRYSDRDDDTEGALRLVNEPKQVQKRQIARKTGSHRRMSCGNPIKHTGIVELQHLTADTISFDKSKAVSTGDFLSQIIASRGKK